MQMGFPRQSFLSEGDPDHPEMIRARRSWYGLITGVLLCVWPIVYFFRYVIPERSFSLALGNDFVEIYYNPKVYLLDLLATGGFTFWSPSEGAGFPFFSSPLPQAVYPLNLIAVWAYKLMGGYSPFDHQLFTVFGVSIFALGLYLWLSLLVKNPRGVIFAVMVMSVSFKVGELLRFPNAVHAAAWMPWLLYGATLAVDVRRRRLGSGVIFLSAVMIITAAYPYYLYYCLFLVPPYVCLMLSARCRRALMGRDCATLLRPRGYLAACIIPALLGVAVCSPYLYKLTVLLGQVPNRSAGTYEFATIYPFTWVHTLGSLIFPPASQTEGWYYFSITGLLMLVMLGAGVCLDRRTRRLEAVTDDRIGLGLPRTPIRGRSASVPLERNWNHRCMKDSSRDLVIILLVWVATISYISYGKHSYLFDLLWIYVPGIRHLRAWGRLSIVMVPIIALGIARAYSYYESMVRTSGCDHEGQRLIRRLLGVLCLGGVGIAAVQLILLHGCEFDPYWQEFFEAAHGTEYYFVVAAVLACTAICVPLGLALKRRLDSPAAMATILVVMVTAATIDMFPVGSSQWSERPTEDSYQRFSIQVSAMLTESLITPRRNGGEMISLTPTFRVGLARNWYYERYVSFYSRFFPDGRLSPLIDAEELAAFEYLMGIKDGRRVFCTRRIDHVSAKGFVRDATEVDESVRPAVVLHRYDGDALGLTVYAGEPVFLSFIDNWDPDWTAEVNGKAVPYETLFGTFKSVRLAPGESWVLFEYRPFAALTPAGIWGAFKRRLSLGVMTGP